MPAPVLVWFRDDLRIADNPALAAAAATGAPLLCAFVLDEESPGLRPLGGAARWWLHGAVADLARSLAERGASLALFRGPAAPLITRIAAETGAAGVTWNRRYAAAEIAIDRTIKAELTGRGYPVHSHNGRLLHEPWEIRTKSGTPFRVFGPYLRAVLAAGAPPPPLPAPARLVGASWPAALRQQQVALESLALEPTRPDWAGGLREAWTRGEAAALVRLSSLREALEGYATARDRHHERGATRLSPHLRFGEISPRQVWHVVMAAAQAGAPHRDVDKLLSEVVWRDFCYQVLHHAPDLATSPADRRFERFAWASAPDAVAAWRGGRTGYPIVDAGMRQLWRTGWIPNRIRMVVASFLVKHLLTDWRLGEQWFWDTLVDADPANNAFNWQWIAGSGPDGAPFHRIFNPITQGETFDADGHYVRTFVPELARLPAAVIHRPWEASPEMLASAGVTLGETYPAPIVPHGAARQRALDAFRTLARPLAQEAHGP